MRLDNVYDIANSETVFVDRDTREVLRRYDWVQYPQSHVDWFLLRHIEAVENDYDRKKAEHNRTRLWC